MEPGILATPDVEGIDVHAMLLAKLGAADLTLFCFLEDLHDLVLSELRFLHVGLLLLTEDPTCSDATHFGEQTKPSKDGRYKR